MAESVCYSLCQPKGIDISQTFNPFNTENRRNCQRYVSIIQGRLDKGVANNDKEKIRWYVHLLTRRSKAAKILAIYHVTVQNHGRYTPGVDGLRMIKGQEERNQKIRKAFLKTIDVKKKPSPIRRVMIPKANGKQRPLGIPTLTDRVIQDVIRMALSPITEYYASNNSYGFRPGRSCHDAIEHLFVKLCKRNSKAWVIEGDIKGCFDHISHTCIIDTLKSWYVPETTVNVVRKMLKSKIQASDGQHERESGTPQGGILSPTLSNVALTGLDNYCKEEFGWKRKEETINPIVRYADDFVVVCKSQQEAETNRRRISEYLRDAIGVELSEEKTKITHIEEGFDFLGFNIRKYRKASPRSKYHKVGQLLITPQKEKVIGFLREIKEVLDSHKTSKPETIIKLLNPKIQGFGMYYRHGVSKKTLWYAGREIRKKLWRWSRRRHPDKTSNWVKKRYFNNRWDFVSKTGGILLDIGKIPIVRHAKVKMGMRVYARDEHNREYWQMREYRNALEEIYSPRVEMLYRKQAGRCLVCGQMITRQDISEKKVHMHHIIPRISGGTDKLNNLRLYHGECHREMHRKSLIACSNIVI